MNNVQRVIIAIGAVLLVGLLAFPPSKKTLYTPPDPSSTEAGETIPPSEVFSSRSEWEAAKTYGTTHRWIGQAEVLDSSSDFEVRAELNIPFLLLEVAVVVILTSGGIYLFRGQKTGDTSNTP